MIRVDSNPRGMNVRTVKGDVRVLKLELIQTVFGHIYAQLDVRDQDGKILRWHSTAGGRATDDWAAWHDDLVDHLNNMIPWVTSTIF